MSESGENKLGKTSLIGLVIGSMIGMGLSILFLIWEAKPVD